MGIINILLENYDLISIYIDFVSNDKYKNASLFKFSEA